MIRELIEVGNSTVSRETFSNTTDLSNYIDTAKTNKLFQGRDLSSHRQKEEDFNDFYTFEDANKALEYGTDIYFEKFNKEFQKVKNYIAQREKQQKTGYKKDFIGFMPIVPNAILGIPDNMINLDMKPKPFPTARIIIEKACNAFIKADDMCSYYAVIFVLIQLLEKRGIRCELWESAVFEEDDEIYISKVKLKDYQQPLNCYKIQFPVIAADMFRRIMFRLLETTPEIKNMWTWGYGHTLIKPDEKIFH